MRIIKNLITRNQLKKELEIVELSLSANGYRAYMNKLNDLRFDPEEYHKLYEEYQAKCGKLFERKLKLESNIRKLSGRNLFKSIDTLDLVK